MTAQENRVTAFHGKVQANEMRQKELDRAVEQLVPNGTDKSKRDAELDIVGTLIDGYVRSSLFRRTLTGTGPNTHKGAGPSLDKLGRDLNKLAKYLDGGTAWPPPRKGVIEPYVARMLRKAGIDVQEEAGHLRALADAAREAKQALPHLKGGRKRDHEMYKLADVCVELAARYGRLTKDPEPYDAVYNLFTNIYPLATGKKLSKREPDDDAGKKACQLALSQWRAQAASGHKEGEHTP